MPAMTFVATFEAVTQAGGLLFRSTSRRPTTGWTRRRPQQPSARARRRSCPCTCTAGWRTCRLWPPSLGTATSSLSRTPARHTAQPARPRVPGRRGGAFSFYPAKNLGAMGDAGALVTDDAELAEAMRALREHGQREKYRHADVGWTARLDTIHAAVLLRKLPYLDEWNAQRRAAADLYIEGLAEVGDLTLPDSSDRGQVWHLFVVRTLDRDGLADHLAASNIGTGCHYPEPPHLSDAYAHSATQRVVPRRRADRQGSPLFRCSPESQKHRSNGLSRASATGSTVADRPINDAPYRTLVGVEFGDQVVVQSFTNLYGCSIGDNTRIGPFVEIQRGAVIGASCKIQSHSFICDGVTIEDEVFVGHGVMFVNEGTRAQPRRTADFRARRTGSSSTRSSSAGRRSVRVRWCSAGFASARMRSSAPARS